MAKSTGLGRSSCGSRVLSFDNKDDLSVIKVFFAKVYLPWGIFTVWAETNGRIIIRWVIRRGNEFEGKEDNDDKSDCHEVFSRHLS